MGGVEAIAAMADQIAGQARAADRTTVGYGLLVVGNDKEAGVR